MALVSLLFLVSVAAVGASLWAAVDAMRFPESAFESAGTGKTFWILLPILGLVMCLVGGLIGALLWFIVYRRRVTEAAGDGPGLGTEAT